MEATVCTAFPFMCNCTWLSDDNLAARQGLDGPAIATTASWLGVLTGSLTGASLYLQALPERVQFWYTASFVLKLTN